MFRFNNYEEYCKFSEVYGNPYTRWLHELMVAIMKGDFEIITEKRKELEEFFMNMNDVERRVFCIGLIDAMYLWAYEFKKAKRFRDYLKQFIDDEDKFIYEDETGEEKAFYDYYF